MGDPEPMRLRYMGIPPAFASASLADFGGRYKPEQFKGGALLTGKAGTGKTHLAAALLRHAGSDGLVSLPAFMVAVRDSFRRGSADSERRFLDDVLDRDYLALDDLGAAKPSDYEAELLYVLIDQRVRSEKWLCVTTNLAPQEIEAIYGDRLASRLAGLGVVRMEGSDRRIGR